jgi:hypothetical protein
MKKTLLLTVSLLVLAGSAALAQNASTGATTTSGDSAVSPAAGGPPGMSSGTNRPSQGTGVNSGVLNNGTTGDTIGTGPGTSGRPSTELGTATAPARKE